MKQKWVITILIVAVALLAFTTYNENKSVKAIKLEIINIEKLNEKLFKDNLKLKNKVFDDSVIIVNSKKKIDSLGATDSLNKKQLKIIRWKYGKIKTDYDNANDVARDSIFAELINN